jgi:hypothetical protein
MNASQRRKIKRRFPFVVTVSVGKQPWHTVEHIEKIEHARTWCSRHIDPADWHSRNYLDCTDFKFAKDADAVFFKLKWS